MTPYLFISLCSVFACSILSLAQTPLAYTGTIGGTSPIHLRLEQKGNTLTGGYYYDKVGIVLSLSGSIDAKNNVLLKERDDKNHSTGIFNGTIKENSFSGTWKGGRNKSLAFTLVRDTSASFSYTYTGSINNTYRIQLRLSRKANELSGMYYYERKGIDIPLRGNINDNDSFVIDEFTENGEKQATFRGRMNADFSLSGTWAKPDGKPMPFALSLNQRIIRHSQEFINRGSVEVFSRIRTDISKNKAYSIAIEYPQIRGLKDFALQQSINRILLPQIDENNSAESVAHEGSKGGEEWSFEVAFNSDSILSLRKFLYSFMEGAAHPNHSSEGISINLRTGKQIRFSDLFQHSAYKSIAQLATKKILDYYQVANLNDILFENTLLLNDSIDISIVQTGIILNFDPYEIAAYAAGDINVECSWAEVAEFLKPGSPVESLVQKYR